MKRRLSLWSILFWGGLLILVLWALAKATGIIKTPIWVEMIPYFSVAAALAGGGIKVGKVLEKISTLCKDMKEVKHDVKEIQKKALCLNTAKCALGN